MKLSEINIRDPFILPRPEDGWYYMTGTRAATCWGAACGFDGYRSRDLADWEGPVELFAKTPAFAPDRCYWAPEIHPWRGAFYAFVTLDRSDAPCKGTWILRAEAPLGPYRLHSDGPVTPAGLWCLDGTFHVDAHGDPWMVFCHEWMQADGHDGRVCAVRLADDLRSAVGEARTLFRASEARPWVRAIERGADRSPCWVTDGPFLHRGADGSLAMLWSSFGDKGYVQALARSDDGEITGRWTVDPTPLFDADGGHGMVFRDFGGRLRLVLHRPNATPLERPVFVDPPPGAFATLQRASRSGPAWSVRKRPSNG